MYKVPNFMLLICVNYSLVKMLYTFVETSGYKKPTWPQLEHSILRNFGGLENVEPVDVFYQNLSSFIIKDQKVG